MMKSLLLVVLLAAAATAAVVSNEVPEVVEMPERVEADEVADVDVKEMPMVFVTDEDELIDETAGATRNILSLGVISPTDVPLSPADFIANPLPGAQVTQQRTFSSNWPITAIRVGPVFGSPNANPTLVSGGIGFFSATIRIQSAVNQGFHYRITIYYRPQP